MIRLKGLLNEQDSDSNNNGYPDETEQTMQFKIAADIMEKLINSEAGIPDLDWYDTNEVLQNFPQLKNSGAQRLADLVNAHNYTSLPGSVPNRGRRRSIDIGGGWGGIL